MRLMWVVLAVAGLAAAATVPALADQGRVGLWTVIVSVDAPGMGQVSAEDRARLAKMGVKMSGNSVTTQHCMTAEEVAANHPPQLQGQKDCKMINAKVSGQTYAADMVCSGQMQGRGHMEVTYDSIVHYSGKMSFNGTMAGQPASMKQTFEGKWVGATCPGP